MSIEMTGLGSAIGVYWLIAKVLSLTFLSMVFQSPSGHGGLQDMVF